MCPVKKTTKKISNNVKTNALKHNSKQQLKTSTKNIDNDSLNTDDIFNFINLYYQNKFIIYKHQYDSYNKFVVEYIKEFLTTNENVFYQSKIGNLQYKYRFKIENIKIFPPTIEETQTIMYPKDAREKNYTYASKIKAKITQYQDKYDYTTKELLESNIVGRSDDNVTIGAIPIMVRSKYCSLNLFPNQELDQVRLEDDYDPGCYFIVNGQEKIIIPQERMIDNKPIILCPKNFDKDPYKCQIRSKSLGYNGITQVMQIYYKPSGLLTFKVPILNEFPLIGLFRIMGYERDEDIVNIICMNSKNNDMKKLVIESIRQSSVQGVKLDTKEKCLNYLANQIRVNLKYYSEDPKQKLEEKKSNVLLLLKNNFLPHITEYNDKIIYIAYCTNKLLKVVLHQLEEDDRDSFTNKRIDLVGDLLGQLFTQLFKQVLKECTISFGKRNASDDRPFNIINSINPNTIEKNLNAACATGKFNNNVGIAQPLARESYILTLMERRKINSPTKSSMAIKMARPRMYHYSQVGFLCPIETPEHKNVGFLKHLSISGTVTTHNIEQIDIIKSIIKKDIIKLTEITDYDDYTRLTKVFINGQWQGMVNDFKYFYNNLYQIKNNGIIDQYTTIILNDITNEIHLWCDAGRLIRPIFTVTDNKLNYTKEMASDIKNLSSYQEFIQKYPGVVEFIDSDKQVFSLICQSYKELEEMYKHERNIPTDRVDPVNRYNDQTFMKYSHCEISPSLLLGTIGSTAPYINHSNNSRNILYYAQGKQALSVYSSNYRYRLDKTYVPFYPMKPLIDTRTSNITYYDTLSPGENVVIAVMNYSGYNQEDAIIINKAALDKGLFRCFVYDKILGKCIKNQETASDEKFCKPDPKETNGVSSINYDKIKNFNKLNEKGYVPEETKIYNNDVVIGKITPVKPTDHNPKAYKDSSYIYKHYMPAVVDKVYSNIINNEGYEMIKVRIRSERNIMIGDKLSTRSAQKGTVGAIFAETDMPYTESGLIPDIIFNPNSIPGRMTMGFILECLFGKAAAVSGIEQDGTPFMEINFDNAKDLLKKHGFDEYGLENMYSGITGEKIQTKIFVCPLYYLRLHHMTSNKISARTTGPMTTLMRQPVDGRSKGGGGRIGEMERDVMLTHGISKYLKEKLLDNSDLYDTHICDKCGMIAQRMKRPDNQIVERPNDVFYCTNCNNATDISKIRIPYAFKILMQELGAIGINMTLET